MSGVLRHWKIALVLAAIFAAGVVTGAVLTLKKVRQSVEANRDWPLTAYRLYKQRLKLTPEQEQKLKPVFDRAGQDLRDVRRQTTLGILGVLRQVNQEVEKELTPDQQAEFQKIREEIRLRLEDRRKTPPGTKGSGS